MMPSHVVPLKPQRARRVGPGIFAGVLLLLAPGTAALLVEAQVPVGPAQAIILVTPEGVTIEPAPTEDAGRRPPLESIMEAAGTVHEADSTADDHAQETEVRAGVTEHAATEQAVPAGPGTQ